MFVTFDGPNGAGKSTIIQELAEYLKFREKRVHITKEPTETEIGKYIRESEENYTSYTLANLVAADRHNHIKTEVIPYLDMNYIVMCDRYIASFLILQVLDGLSLHEVMSINTGVLKPDLSVIVYASEETINERLADRSTLTRFERDYSSKNEIDLSLQAGKYLENKGYKMLYIDTDVSLEKNIEKLGNIILRVC